MTDTPLRELTYSHPYHQEQGCYYSNDCHHSYYSWEDFLAEWECADIDYNRVIRWDWYTPDDEDVQIGLEENPKDPPMWVFEHVRLYYMLQRKARPISCYVRVTADDDDAVREFLKPHAEYSAQLWGGVLRPADCEDGDE